jgi:hypothetical protein
MADFCFFGYNGLSIKKMILMKDTGAGSDRGPDAPGRL